MIQTASLDFPITQSKLLLIVLALLFSAGLCRGYLDSRRLFVENARALCDQRNERLNTGWRWDANQGCVLLLEEMETE